MAISTYKTFLMVKNASNSWVKVIDIKDFSDLGGEPESLETTTLSNGGRTYIPGLQSQEPITFTYNYTKNDYTAVKTYADSEHEFAVWFGASTVNNALSPDGSEGKFQFAGKLTTWVSGGGVNEVVDGNISIMPSTDVTLVS